MAERIIEQKEGYTTFKNTNVKLVEEIKSTKLDVFIVNGVEMVIRKKLNETQNLCLGKDELYYILLDKQICEMREENLLTFINNKFDITKELIHSLGPLYSGYKTITFHNCSEYWKNKGEDFERGNENFKHYKSLGRVMSVETGVELRTNGALHLCEGELGGSSMFCYFNEEGNIENRDYNYNISKFFSNQQKTRQELVEEILSHIPDTKYYNYGNKWFSKDVAFILENENDIEENTIFYLKKLKHSHGDNYVDIHSSKAKKPKSAIEVTRDHILSKILPLVNKIKFGEHVDLSQYIDLSKILPEKKAVKRVQKTKLELHDFSDIFVIKEHSEYEDIPKEIMIALLNISEGINSAINDDIVSKFLIDILEDYDLPSFSFDKGEAQKNHGKYIALVKLPHNINYTFKVEEGELCEVSHSGSIYSTDIIELQIVE